MSPRQRLLPFLVVACTLVGAACSGSDENADTTVETSADEPTSTTVVDTAPPATSASTTEASPGTTTAETDPSVSEPAPTTEASTTTSPTTGSSTSEPPATPEEEVAAAIEFFEQQWKECLRTLPDCDLEAASERTRGDLNAETLSTASAFNSNDYRAENIDGLEYRVDDVSIDDAGTTATAAVCVTDPVKITEADGTPVDDRFVTSVQEFVLELNGEVWEWVMRTTVGEVGETEVDNKCA